VCHRQGLPDNPNDNGWGRGRQPVMGVTWEDITNEYLPWLRSQTGKFYRLLTEAEWEYAARAGSRSKYTWGDETGKNRANCAGCGSEWDRKQAAPVGSFSTNAFGLFDVHGNVWEWVQDCYKNSYAGAPSDGGAVSGSSGCPRVLRGGSWIIDPSNLRSSNRYRYVANGRSFGFGFRLARTLNP
jgi:formylglycine-generating enzyme required for sulfatase activity